MQVNVKVSVIIPVYQAEQYLEQTLQSILRQTFDDFEVVIVDDGSKDASAYIYKTYSNRDARLRIIKQDNAGPSAARNNGIESARGEYIVFLDSDDLMNPNALATMVSAMETHQTDLVMGMYAIWNGRTPIEKARAFYHLFNEDTVCINQTDVAMLFGRTRTSLLGVSVWGKLYKRSIIEANHVRFPLDIHYEEDCSFNLQYYAYIKSAAVLYMTVNYYRIRQDSLSKSYNPGQFPFLIIGYQGRKDFARSLGLETLEKQIDEVFFVVTISQLKKVSLSRMRCSDKMQAYRHILSHQEAQYVLQHEGSDAGIVSRRIAKQALRKHMVAVTLLLELWKAKKWLATHIRNIKNRYSTESDIAAESIAASDTQNDQL